MRVDKKRRGGGKGEKREKILEPRVERGDRAREAMGEGEGRAVITAQLNRLNNVERPTRRNSRRMSYRSRYFLRRGGAEKKKKGRGGILKRRGAGGGIDHAIIGNATIGAAAPINPDASSPRVLPSFVASGNNLTNNPPPPSPPRRFTLSYVLKKPRIAFANRRGNGPKLS